MYVRSQGCKDSYSGNASSCETESLTDLSFQDYSGKKKKKKTYMCNNDADDYYGL